MYGDCCGCGCSRAGVKAPTPAFRDFTRRYFDLFHQQVVSSALPQSLPSSASSPPFSHAFTYLHVCLLHLPLFLICLLLIRLLLISSSSAFLSSAFLSSPSRHLSSHHLSSPHLPSPHLPSCIYLLAVLSYWSFSTFLFVPLSTPFSPILPLIYVPMCAKNKD